MKKSLFILVVMFVFSAGCCFAGSDICVSPKSPPERAPTLIHAWYQDGTSKQISQTYFVDDLGPGWLAYMPSCVYSEKTHEYYTLSLNNDNAYKALAKTCMNFYPGSKVKKIKFWVGYALLWIPAYRYINVTYDKAGKQHFSPSKPC